MGVMSMTLVTILPCSMTLTVSVVTCTGARLSVNTGKVS